MEISFLIDTNMSSLINADSLEIKIGNIKFTIKEIDDGIKLRNNSFEKGKLNIIPESSNVVRIEARKDLT